MNVVDSSAWLAYFTESANAAVFADAIEDTEQLIVPAICLLEVFKKVLRERSEGEALRVAAQMQLGHVALLDDFLAVEAARYGHQYRLPLADSIIFATAQRFKATLWTQDADFEGLPNVHYVTV